LVTASFHETVKKASTHYRGAVSSAKLHWPTDYQPGGTAVAVRNEWATRYLSHGHDDLGRWSWVTLAGQNKSKITFLSGYRVCDGANESNITSRTVRAQQEWIYSNRGETNVDLRKTFVTDLIILTKSFQDQGCDVVLMLDANEGRGPKSGVDYVMHECCLVDAHAATTDRSPAPATHQRGSEKIDFILMSPRLVESIRSAVILPLQEGYLSDHRSLMVDFDANMLFGGQTSFIARSASRRLTSTNPRAVATYIEHMRNFISTHRIVDKVCALQVRSDSDVWCADDIAEYEVIDSLLQEGRISAENKCKQRDKCSHPWSPELELAGNAARYWKMRIWEMSGSYSNDVEMRRVEKVAGIKEDEKEWMTTKDIRSRCRKARKNLKEVQSRAVELREAHTAEAAKLAALLHRTSESGAQKAIAAREKASRQFRQLRSSIKDQGSNGVDRIDIPDSFAVLGEGEKVPRIQLVIKEDK
jgi:hypothetical protein